MEKVANFKNEVVKDVEVVKLYDHDVRFSSSAVKKISEMTNEDIENLKNCQVAVLASVYNQRRRTHRYTLTVHFKANVVKETINLNLDDFTLICASHGIAFNPLTDLKDTVIPCKVRFLHGVAGATSSVPGEAYASFQLFPLGNKINVRRNLLYYHFFVDEKKLILFELAGLNDKITYKTAPAGDSEPVTFDEIDY